MERSFVSVIGISAHVRWSVNSQLLEGDDKGD
jgi:hypothetical protein